MLPGAAAGGGPARSLAFGRHARARFLNLRFTLLGDGGRHRGGAIGWAVPARPAVPLGRIRALTPISVLLLAALRRMPLRDMPLLLVPLRAWRSSRLEARDHTA
ncbi:MAG TPA: hypothetical protein VLF65_13535, partial [Burkholderiales bacterium]|nr:hypothetical protein [Burkholderiales bacterium]